MFNEQRGPNILSGWKASEQFWHLLCCHMLKALSGTMQTKATGPCVQLTFESFEVET